MKCLEQNLERGTSTTTNQTWSTAQMSKVIDRNFTRPCPNAIFLLQSQFMGGVLPIRWAEGCATLGGAVLCHKCKESFPWNHSSHKHTAGSTFPYNSISQAMLNFISVKLNKIQAFWKSTGALPLVVVGMG